MAKDCCGRSIWKNIMIFLTYFIYTLIPYGLFGRIQYLTFVNFVLRRQANVKDRTALSCLLFAFSVDLILIMCVLSLFVFKYKNVYYFSKLKMLDCDTCTVYDVIDSTRKGSQNCDALILKNSYKRLDDTTFKNSFRTYLVVITAIGATVL